VHLVIVPRLSRLGCSVPSRGSCWSVCDNSRRAWQFRTSAAKRVVKDVVAHLLDVELRRLSIQRDGYRAPPPAVRITTYEGLVAYLDGLNAEWTRAAQRPSPRVLIDLLEPAALVRSVSAAPAGTRIALHVLGESGGEWYLECDGEWQLYAGSTSAAGCTISIEDLQLARLLMHRLARRDIHAAVRVDGSRLLAEPLLSARAVMVDTNNGSRPHETHD
jgi:hypothetical protein